MKRLQRHIGIIAGTWLIGSCGGEGVVAPPPVPKTGLVTVSQDTATLVPAGTLQLSAEAKNASGEVLQRTFSWTTSDPSKAAVSNSGLVVGVDVGTATITATADGKSATARITILDGGVVSTTGATLTLQSGSVHLVVPANAVASRANLWIAASTPL
ncbi:MAG TPA: Ig-like domain-containing protein, partial [Gemmatimonadaceae bacterium]|nr:Ig-like domain-containing protein [Gemmatimonadaceae bacterium]